MGGYTRYGRGKRIGVSIAWTRPTPGPSLSGRGAGNLLNLAKSSLRHGQPDPKWRHPRCPHTPHRDSLPAKQQGRASHLRPPCPAGIGGAHEARGAGPWGKGSAPSAGVRGGLDLGLIHRDADPGHPALPSLLARLGAADVLAVPRYPLPGNRQGRCYWNVRDQVRMQGGSCLFGWMLVEIPGVVLFGWHHAVWRAPSGPLTDISPHPLTGWGVGSTAFAVDPVQDHPLDWPPGLPDLRAAGPGSRARPLHRRRGRGPYAAVSLPRCRAGDPLGHLL